MIATDKLPIDPLVRMFTQELTYSYRDSLK